MRHLECKEAFEIIDTWITKCSELKPLKFDSDSRINYDLGRVGRYFPISFEDLKDGNRRLYDIVSKLLSGKG